MVLRTTMKANAEKIRGGCSMGKSSSEFEYRHVYHRVATRSVWLLPSSIAELKREFESTGVVSFFGPASGQQTWEHDGTPYICASGLNKHFHVPEYACELDVYIIVNDKRPHPDAQNIHLARSSNDLICLEGPENPLLCGRVGLQYPGYVHHATYKRFGSHYMRGVRKADQIGSRCWMFVAWA